MKSNGAFDREQPIPGYHTIDLLGRGGYGEVWRAIAPGGIAKAVKIVYGDNDESHAATEMRALARVKDVRHPLILSIERIEVSAGNLVIVTELADESLKQRFTTYRSEGKDGVPLEELLGYLADTADALDFLYERHSLQHMDVKPENILLIGGRAKLGDFGLVKSLYERGASMIGGLTPTFAAPELFEGKPNRHSDQYSLAIVYVNMLTGALPFAAANMAQLASMHLKSVPDLSMLSKRQRAVVARALSKDPVQRYESCAAMVRALRAATQESDTAPRPLAPLAAPRDEAPTTTMPLPASGGRESSIMAAIADAAPRGRSAATAISDTASAPSAAAPVVAVAPSAIDGTPPPTLFVGVGGAGVDILSKVVRRLNDRFGRAAQWPAVEMLAFDTNTRSLTAQFVEDDLARVRPIPIALRPAESYGAQSGEFLRWLGRRWFYNIPRDLTTGGYRPLGRLALLTHARRVRDEIAAVVGRVAQLCQAARGAGAPVAPRVVLVGSLSGGTSGGSMIDIAYAIRSELKRRKLPDDVIDGTLLYAAPRVNAERDKARANAYAGLKELDHFSRHGGHYPGEPLLASPPFHGDNATFARKCFLNLGEGLGQAEWDLATDQVAELLYATSFSPAGRAAEASGKLDSSEEGVVKVQPFDVLSLSTGTSPTLVHATRVACNDVIRLWCDGRTPEGAAATQERTAIMNSFVASVATKHKLVDDEALSKLAALDLTYERFLADAVDMLQREIGTTADKLAARLVDEGLSATAEHAGAARVDALFALLDRYLQSESQSASDQFSCDALYVQIEGRLSTHARGCLEPVLGWLGEQVDAPERRIEGARQCAVVAQRHLQALGESVVTQAGELRDRAREIELVLRNPESQKAERSRFGFLFRKQDPAEKLRAMLVPYAQARVGEMLRRATAKMVRIVVAELSSFVENVDRLARALEQLPEPTRELAAAADDDLPTGSSPALAAFRETLGTQLSMRRESIARSIEDALQSRLFQGELRLSGFLRPESELRKHLWRPLAETARETVLAAIRDVFRKIVSGDVRLQGGDLVTLLAGDARRDGVSGRSPVLGRVLIVPDEVDPASFGPRLEAAMPGTLVVPGGRCDVTLWTIRQPVPAEQLANALIGGNEQYKELASKLHSRVDLTWLPFFASPVDERPAASNEPAQNASMMTHTAMLPR